MPEPRKLRVFLCHASQDKPIVRELYQRLNAEGWIDPWLDEEKLLPGQNWDMEIEKAVEAADAVIVCLSTYSVTKEGYVQRELKFALDIALEKPDGVIFIIPLRLDDCLVPRRLKGYQYQDYFPFEKTDSAYTRLIKSLMSRSTDLGITTSVPEKYFQPIRLTGKGNMLNGPKLTDGKVGLYFGTYQVLVFTEKERGKILKISANSDGEIFWIELWKEIFDGVDVGEWARARIPVSRSPHRFNPDLTWRIEPGDYTVYFVAYDKNGKGTDFDVSYNIIAE